MHEKDLARGIAHVPLPDALERKFPNAVKELGWQFLFASRQLSRDPRSGKIGRFHIHENAVQRAVTAAVRKTGLTKRISCHTFRHSFATHLLERGVDILWGRIDKFEKTKHCHSWSARDGRSVPMGVRGVLVQEHPEAAIVECLTAPGPLRHRLAQR